MEMPLDLIASLANRIKSETGVELSKRAQDIIEMYLVEVLRENEDLRNRVDWLEEAVDQSNLEDIFVKYQKTFDIECWSGDAT